jgi:hypothetical protein
VLLIVDGLSLVGHPVAAATARGGRWQDGQK